MTSLKWHAILVFVFVAYQPSVIAIVNNGEDLIESSCKKTENQELCVKTLRSNPRSSTADVEGLARIIMDVVSSKAKETLSVIENLQKNTSDRVTKECLGICTSQYESVLITWIPDAAKSLNSNKYKSARDELSNAMESAEYCEQVFTEGPSPRPSPITARNKLNAHLPKIALFLVAILG